MYSIYHFFAYLLHVRGRFRFVPNITKYPFPAEPMSYQDKTGFPSLVLRLNPGGDPPGGEMIGIKNSRAYSIARFRSHVPAGAMSIDSLGLDKAKDLYKSMKSAGEGAESMRVRDVYYLIRGKHSGYTKVCLVHGSFFETVKVEKVVRLALRQVLTDCLDEDKRTVRPELTDAISRVMTQEIFSQQFRRVKNATLAFRLDVSADVIKKANLLSPKYYPAIRDDTLSFVVPYRLDEDFRERRRHLKSVLSEEEWLAGRKMVLKHPMNGDFFVLSYSL